jgi:hypothetical protein
MNRVISLSALVFALGLTVRAWAGPPESEAPLPSGVSFVHFNLSVASTLPSGSIILCRGELVPGSNNFNGGGGGASMTPLAEAASTTELRGSTAECALEIPFSWTGNGGRSNVSVRYEVDALTSPGVPPVVLKRGVEPAIRIVQPPAAGVLRLSFNTVR